jgi:AraC-like DNA-binding protein
MRYLIVRNLTPMCQMLEIAPETVLRRAGISPDLLSNEGRGVTARQFFAIVAAVPEIARRPDLPLFLGQAFARGPFNPPLFAYSCSPDVTTGLERLALFKSLIGPMQLILDHADAGLTLRCESVEPGCALPDVLAAMELVFMVECTRLFTASHVVPLAVGIPKFQQRQQDLDAMFGVKAHLSEHPLIIFSPQDAARKLVSENAGFWRGYEKDLQHQLSEQQNAASVASRVRLCLQELLPSGRCGIEDVCERLQLSRRSLQRHLRSEGQSFRGILDQLRAEISQTYLAQDQLTVEEISYLLAYRDPNSFYRAFQSWTGMTPREARIAQTGHSPRVPLIYSGANPRST